MYNLHIQTYGITILSNLSRVHVHNVHPGANLHPGATLHPGANLHPLMCSYVNKLCSYAPRFD